MWLRQGLLEALAKAGPLIGAGRRMQRDLHQTYGGCRYKEECGGGFGVLENQDKFRFVAGKENERPWFPGDCPSHALLELG